MARQRAEETTASFLDRPRILARRTIPCVTDPVMQRAFNEQAERLLVASYTSGLTGLPGRQVRLVMPVTADEALRIAVTAAQAEVQEAC
jgi:hypothetical protein